MQASRHTCKRPACLERSLAEQEFGLIGLQGSGKGSNPTMSSFSLVSFASSKRSMSSCAGRLFLSKPVPLLHSENGFEVSARTFLSHPCVVPAPAGEAAGLSFLPLPLSFFSSPPDLPSGWPFLVRLFRCSFVCFSCWFVFVLFSWPRCLLVFVCCFLVFVSFCSCFLSPFLLFSKGFNRNFKQAPAGPPNRETDIATAADQRQGKHGKTHKQRKHNGTTLTLWALPQS